MSRTQAQWMSLGGAALAGGLVAIGISYVFRRRAFPTFACLSTTNISYVSSEKKTLLLISNSNVSGLSYLDHVEAHIQQFLGTLSEREYILFVPYAKKDRDGYEELD